MTLYLKNNFIIVSFVVNTLHTQSTFAFINSNKKYTLNVYSCDQILEKLIRVLTY